MICNHKFTNLKVAIKTIDILEYVRLQKENRISEVDAMVLCQDSDFIVKFIEKFTLDDQVYIVTKFAPGGDLLNYCL